VVVQQCLFAQVAPGSKEGTNLAGGDAIHGGIFTQEVLQAAKGVGVVCDCVGAEATCVGVQKIAFKGV